MLRDLRKYSRETNLRLFAGFILILLLVGEGLIWLIYGGRAAFFGLLCILAGVLPIALIVFLLWIGELILKRVDHG